MLNYQIPFTPCLAFALHILPYRIRNKDILPKITAGAMIPQPLSSTLARLPFRHGIKVFVDVRESYMAPFNCVMCSKMIAMFSAPSR